MRRRKPYTRKSTATRSNSGGRGTNQSLPGVAQGVYSSNRQSQIMPKNVSFRNGFQIDERGKGHVLHREERRKKNNEYIKRNNIAINTSDMLNRVQATGKGFTDMSTGMKYVERPRKHPHISEAHNYMSQPPINTIRPGSGKKRGRRFNPITDFGPGNSIRGNSDGYRSELNKPGVKKEIVETKYGSKIRVKNDIQRSKNRRG